VFFESPPTFAGGGGGAEGVGSAHLFMRDTANNTTTPLDSQGSAAGAQYEGASQDGSKVFFTSTEGLAGNTNTDNELYEFNTTNGTLGTAPAMSAISLSEGNDSTNPQDGDVLGVTAISNDGSKVYFVADGVLAGNQTPAARAPSTVSRTSTSTTRPRRATRRRSSRPCRSLTSRAAYRTARPTDLEPC
jgi:hypothetical protein